MKKNLKYILTIFFLNSSLFAYHPTPEGLFRNSRNIDLNKKTVVATLNIKKVFSHNQFEEREESVKNEYNKNFLIKIFLGNFDERKTYFAQVNYQKQDNVQRPVSIIEKNTFDLTNLGLNNEQLDKQLFYALVGSLLNNSSDLFISLLKGHGSIIPSNDELINREKLLLLKKYIYFLRSHPTSEDRKNAQNHPLKPQVDVEKKQVHELLNSSLYLPTEYVKIKKENDRYFWEVKDSFFEAKFDYESHFFSDLKITSPLGKPEVYFGRTLLYDGTFEFPEKIVFIDSNKQSYEISLKRLSSFPDNYQAWRKRISKTREDLKTVINTNEIPSFVVD